MDRQVSGSTITGIAQWPVLALGFRPFYLLAGVFAVVAMPIWVAVFFGRLSVGTDLPGVAWHSHEMVFGFAVAVIAGFLLAAVKNWTGRATPTGGPLLALATLWLSARLLMLLGPQRLAAVVDFAFLPAIAVAVAIPILRSGDKRNIKVLAVLGGFALTNLVFHLAYLGMLPLPAGRIAIVSALDLIVILIAIIAGRVIPAFSANAVPGARPRHVAGVEIAAFGSLLLILTVDIAGYWYSIPSRIVFAVLLVAAAAHTVRLALWSPQKTRRIPLLWMLPVGYAWIPVALIVRAAAIQSDGMSESAAFHSLTIGAMASLMFAMMTRSALGHTGRALHAGRVELSGFLLLQLAVMLRVLPGYYWPQHYLAFVVTAAFVWTMAFSIFVIGYFNILTKRRIDGRPG